MYSVIAKVTKIVVTNGKLRDMGSRYGLPTLRTTAEKMYWKQDVRNSAVFCELSELVHQSLYVLHSPGKPVTSRDLLNIYTQYLNWYDRIPEVLRLGHNFTPAVLFAQ